MAAAGAAACARSLDIIEKVAAAHEGDAAVALMRTCTELLLSSGLPLQLFKCFCARAASLNSFDPAASRCQLLLLLLSTTCRCIHAAAVRGIDVPLPVTAGIAAHFALARLQDGQPHRASAAHLMAIMMSQPKLGPAASAALLLMSLLLSHCITSTLMPPDTSLLFPVALHVMRHSPLSLIAILSPHNSAPHLPPLLTSHACASLLLALASSATLRTLPSAAAAPSFTMLLLRFALIHFARDSPLPPATSALYHHVFALIATAIERFPPGAIDALAARPLLLHLAADDDCDAPVELVELYKLRVLKEDAAAGACAAVLQAALDAAHNVAVADVALELMQMEGGGNADDCSSAARALQHADLDGGDKVWLLAPSPNIDS